MEHEIRFYYSLDEYKNKLNQLEKITELTFKGRMHEITSQFDHPTKEMSFYSKKIDGRFRVRKSENENYSNCILSWKRRLDDTTSGNINKEEEIELTIKSEEYNNLMYIIINVLHMKEVEVYERYRSIFSNKEIEIVLDEYPFGLALEIEAKKDNDNPELVIDKYIKILNLNYNDAYRLSWDDKYKELCEEQNIMMHNKVLFGMEMPKVN